MNVLATELPPLGISSCYLALYQDPTRPAEGCRLVLAYDENGRVDLEPGGRPLSTRRLAIGGELAPDKAHQMLVAPLHFQNEPLGIILFAQHGAGDMYEVLRDEISVTLKGVLLAEENVRLYRQALDAQAEAQEGRQMAEEADRLKSSFLSMVSHELLTPLVLLVGLSEMMLREGTGNRPPLPEPYRSDPGSHSPELATPGQPGAGRAGSGAEPDGIAQADQAAARSDRDAQGGGAGG